MTAATAERRGAPALVRRFARALGPPVSTPRFVADGKGGTERSRYRVFLWRCPVCGGGDDDPLGIYRPLHVDSAGHVWCAASRCSLDDVLAEVSVRHYATTRLLS